MQPNATQSAPQPGAPQRAASIDVDRVMAALSYLNVLVFVPLLWGGNADYVRHHLRQGIMLFIVGVLVSLTAWIWFPLWALANLAVAAASFFSAYQAFIGKRWMMPVLGKYAQRLRL